MNMLFTAFLAIGVTIIDFKYETHKLYCSLPLKRSWIVMSRYALSLAALIIGMIVCYGLGIGLDRLLEPEVIFLSLADVTATITPYITFVLLFTALYYPLYFRFGISKGFLGLVFILMLSGVMLSLLAFLLHRLLGWGSSANPLQLLPEVLAALRGIFAGPLGIMLLYICLAGIAAGSLALSCRYFKMREF